MALDLSANEIAQVGQTPWSGIFRRRQQGRIRELGL
jgi:hypothetical protein